MDLVIKKLRAVDIEYFNQLLTVFDKVFEHESYVRPDREHLNILLNQYGFNVIVAIVNGQVIAGFTAYVLEQYYSIKPILYIQDLAVLTEFQRKGVGSKLMNFAKAFCIDHNFQLLSVQAEREDVEAVSFYHSLAPAEVLEAIYFAYSTDQ